MTRSRTLALLVVPVLVALTGCSSESVPTVRPSASAPSTPSTASPTPSPTPTPTRSPVPRGELPALSPAVTGPPVWTGDSVRIALPHRSSAVVALRGHVHDDGVEAGDVRLVVTSGRRTARAPVPAGWPPAVLPVPVETRERGHVGLVVSQEGGDSDTWTVYVWSPGGLVPARRTSPVPLGGGFTRDGVRAYRSWVNDAGVLYTRVGVRGQRFKVWRWRVDGTALRSTALGTMCLGDRAGEETYRRC